MKYHEIKKPFKITINGNALRAVAVECDTLVYDGETFRKTCKGCLLAQLKFGWCSGHEYKTWECLVGGARCAKCAPEYREDGKYIHYKWIKKI